MPTPSCFGYVLFGAEAQVNVALILSLVYVVCYVIMEPLAGSIGAALITSIYLYSGHLVRFDPTPKGKPTKLFFFTNA